MESPDSVKTPLVPILKKKRVSIEMGQGRVVGGQSERRSALHTKREDAINEEIEEDPNLFFG